MTAGVGASRNRGWTFEHQLNGQDEQDSLDEKVAPVILSILSDSLARDAGVLRQAEHQLLGEQLEAHPADRDQLVDRGS